MAYSKGLQDAGFSHEQAEKITRLNANAFKSLIDTRELATKEDLLILKHDFQIALVETKHDTLKWLMGMMTAQTTLILTAFGIGIAILK